MITIIVPISQKELLKKYLTELENLKNPVRAKVSAGFFKTGKGEYGEGDVFWGISVPEQRIVARKYVDRINFADLKYLLRQSVHELRFSALAILVLKYQKNKKESEKEKIVKFYLKNMEHINNWDLVDLSAPQILGDYFLNKNKNILFTLVNSQNFWERRIAVVATYGFIKNNKFDDALKIIELVLFDKQDLIHKAVGWMLREIGKRNKKSEVDFLDKYAKRMPRTALRYAIEKFPKEEREKWLG